MPFLFLKYLQPTRYFRLKIKNNRFVYPDPNLLPEFVKENLKDHATYKAVLSRDYDLSWQAIENGYIGNSKTFKSFENVSIYDNYLFTRKYFHWAQALFILVIRIISLKNPLNEISAWYRTRKVHRNKNFEPIYYEDWNRC